MKSERLLRRALSANIGFSAVSAILCLTLPSAASALTGIPRADLVSLGVELAIFAVAIGLLLRTDLSATWPRRAVATIIVLDALWVVASGVVLLAPGLIAPVALTTAGMWIVGAVAFVVADLAFFQWMGWRGMARATTPAMQVAPVRAEAA
ncbi:MAG: hypothetical protein AAGD38_15200 [Acidobacteriota bacterium]